MGRTGLGLGRILDISVLGIGTLFLGLGKVCWLSFTVET